MARLQKHYSIDSVMMHDMDFFISESRTAEIAERMSPLGLRWWALGRIDTLMRYSDRTWQAMADSGLARDGSRRYPGTCREGLPAGRSARAWRVRAQGVVGFEDGVQGWQQEDLAADSGDYVVLRADGLFAYQLAVVVDDADAGITHVVRGADLLDSTARQIHLQGLLGLPSPYYAHLPVATNAAGEKLSKQTLARAIDTHPPAHALLAALRFLGQAPPAALGRANTAELWQWALHHWQLSAVPRCRHAPAVDID